MIKSKILIVPEEQKMMLNDPKYTANLYFKKESINEIRSG